MAVFAKSTISEGIYRYYDPKLAGRWGRAQHRPCPSQIAGFKIRSATPILFIIRPGDYAWQWPKAWIASSCKRLVESGEMDQTAADLLAAEFREMENDPETIMLSPSVLEVIAERSAEA